MIIVIDKSKQLHICPKSLCYNLFHKNSKMTNDAETASLYMLMNVYCTIIWTGFFCIYLQFCFIKIIPTIFGMYAGYSANIEEKVQGNMISETYGQMLLSWTLYHLCDSKNTFVLYDNQSIYEHTLQDKTLNNGNVTYFTFYWVQLWLGYSPFSL